MADQAGSGGLQELRLEGISKSFKGADLENGEVRDRPVLDGVSFSIRRGEFVVLFGPNASGKTTLLKIIAGLEPADRGAIAGPEHGMKIDLIFQDYRNSLLPWRNALDNIALPLELQDVGKRDRLDAARDVLGRIGAEILAESEYEKYPYQLSGGQQQLVAFARAVIRRPDLLLLDEPFAALDYDTRRLMQDALVRVWEEMQFLVLFVSHSVTEAVYLADQVVLLSQKPAQVVDVVEIPVARPRSREFEYSPEFFDLSTRILRVFDERAGQAPHS